MDACSIMSSIIRLINRAQANGDLSKSSLKYYGTLKTSVFPIFANLLFGNLGTTMGSKFTSHTHPSVLVHLGLALESQGPWGLGPWAPGP